MGSEMCIRDRTALAFWKEHVDFTANYTEQKFAVFNPAFQELDAPEPFNWNLLNNSDVTTEYNKPESLFARFKGSRTRVIAQQYIAWKPTPSVKLVLDFVHKYDKNNGKFHIDIACAETQTLIGKYDIAHTSRGGVETFDIPTIPTACDIAYIEIKASPGNFSRAINMTLNRLDIEFPVGSPRGVAQ